MNPDNNQPAVVGQGDPNYWKTNDRAAESSGGVASGQFYGLISDEEIRGLLPDADRVLITPNNNPGNGQVISKSVGVRLRLFSSTANISYNMSPDEQRHTVRELMAELKAMNRKNDYQIIQAAKAKGVEPVFDDPNSAGAKPTVIMAKEITPPPPATTAPSTTMETRMNAMEQQMNTIITLLRGKQDGSPTTDHQQSR